MLYYIHGYLSSPKSHKARLFAGHLQAKAIRYRDCAPEDLVIGDCLARIREAIAGDEQVSFIGSSLGGFLAAVCSLDNRCVKNLILLNPAIAPPKIDLTMHRTLPERICRNLIEDRLFGQKLFAKVDIIRATGDEVIPLDWNLQFAMHHEACIHFFHDDHRFSQYMEQLPQIITQILEQS